MSRNRLNDEKIYQWCPYMDLHQVPSGTPTWILLIPCDYSITYNIWRSNTKLHHK